MAPLYGAMLCTCPPRASSQPVATQKRNRQVSKIGLID
jgi:hypothetical protein